MKRICDFLTSVVLLFIIISFIDDNTVYANTREFLFYIDNSTFNSYNAVSGNLNMTRKGNVIFEFDEDTYGELEIEITNQSGKQIYYKSYDFLFDPKMFVASNLGKGNYTIIITREDESCDCYVSVYKEYFPDVNHPEISISDSEIEIDKNKNYPLKLSLNPTNVKYSVYWDSDDDDIASVNNKGVVKGKSIGKTKIYADIYINNVLYKTLKCKVTVKSGWNYKKFSKQMKKYAKKYKYLSYKDIDKGRICRLYAYPHLISIPETIRTRGFGSGAVYKFFIELKRTKKGLTLKYYFYNDFFQVDIYDDVDLEPLSLKMKSSNRMLKYDLSYITGRSYVSEGVHCGEEKSRAVISDASNINKKKLKKFKKMLGQSSTRYKVYCSGGAYIEGAVNSTARKSAKQLVDVFNKLAKNI